jgi:hypothetical protein
MYKGFRNVSKNVICSGCSSSIKKDTVAFFQMTSNRQNKSIPFFWCEKCYQMLEVEDKQSLKRYAEGSKKC